MNRLIYRATKWLPFGGQRRSVEALRVNYIIEQQTGIPFIIMPHKQPTCRAQERGN
jgi:hypothetical protein